MATRKKAGAADAVKPVNYTVAAENGLNLREEPSRMGRILRILPVGERVSVDAETPAPEGWVALKGGGFVMAQYLK